MASTRDPFLPLIALLVCAGPGCDAPQAPDAGVDAGGDAGTDAGVDAGRDAGSDAGSIEDADAGPPDAWVRLTLRDGGVAVGERIALYDHAIWWWEPSDERTHALFDPAGLAEWPEDRSLRFISSRDVLAEERAPREGETYRDAMRSRGVVLERVPLDGVATVITGHERYHLEENGYGDFAWDLVRTDDRGDRFRGAGASNDDFFVWGAQVLAPVAGVVVEVVRDAPDQTPGTLDLDAVNNLVGIQVYGGYHVYLLHFEQGSIPPEIEVGARVEVGAPLGRVGNSGVSLEPHLHVTALAVDRDADPLRTWSVPCEWRGVWVSAGGRRARLEPHWVPSSDERLSSTSF
ncbi:MAG: M23 family metallopeptidase [Sandaracinaceae bacterium]